MWLWLMKMEPRICWYCSWLMMLMRIIPQMGTEDIQWSSNNEKGEKFRFISVVWNFALKLEKKSFYIGQRILLIMFSFLMIKMTYSFKMTVRDCAYSCWPSSVFVKKLKFYIMINGGILSDSHHYHRRQKLAIALKLFHGAMSWDLGVVQYVFPLNAKVSGLFHLDFAQLWGITSLGWWVWASLLLQSPVKWIISVQQLSPQQFHCRKTFTQAPANKT